MSARLRLRAADATLPKPPPVPRAALEAVGATGALWRAKAGDGRVVALVEHRVADGMRLVRDDVSLLVATAKGALESSFPLGRDRTPHGFRDVVHADPTGMRFLYAYDRAVHELDLRTGTLQARYTLPEDEEGPYEALHLGDGAVAASESALHLLGPDWAPRATVALEGLGYVHLARIGELVVASSYDVGSTPAGPRFTPAIVAFRAAGDRLEEVARGKGPGRDPVVVDGRLYVKQGRGLHEVFGLP